MANAISIIYFIIGDLNSIVSREEKFGRIPFDNTTHNPLEDFMFHTSMADLGFSGVPFTWTNKRKGAELAKLRLDHALASVPWRTTFQDVTIRNLWSSARTMVSSFSTLTLYRITSPNNSTSNPFRLTMRTTKRPKAITSAVFLTPTLIPGLSPISHLPKLEWDGTQSWWMEPGIIATQGGFGFVIKTHNQVVIGAGFDSAQASNPEGAKVLSMIRGMVISYWIGFTIPLKNKKDQQEITGDTSQDTPKQAKKLNGEMLHTFLALCKSELEATKDVCNVWFYQRVKYNAWTWLLRRTRNGFNAETRMFHLPPEECDALIKINENISTFRKGGLPYEDLLEAIFANRVATGQYATGPSRDNFIDTTTSDVAADFNIEDENDVPTDLVEEDIDTYFTNHHYEPSGGSFCTWSEDEPSIPQPK
ncbi:hypothetical protein GIB67_030161 [Kingdonia uniflora]|uniref:Uncharacterized protein n=1 Tax=Kingdonia uniflora TaxID=39325 RepID=A0A7J7LEI4_9MAGN|nr:hypothetical protein GIB67_030161 [Kingdonia uniflora]